ncbi:hypothetical protein AAMO2058_000923200 [Amorphochlora amoebiformis]
MATDEWSLLATSPPDLAKLLQAIDRSDAKGLEEIVKENEGLLEGKSDQFGPWTLFMIASGHANGLWVLEKYFNKSDIDHRLPIGDGKEEDGEATASMLEVLTSPALYKDAKRYYPGLEDKGFTSDGDGKAFKISKEGGWSSLLICTLLGPICNLIFVISRANLNSCTAKTKQTLVDVAGVRGNPTVLGLLQTSIRSKFSQKTGWNITLEPLQTEIKVLLTRARIPKEVWYKFMGLKISSLTELSEFETDALLISRRAVLPGHLARVKRYLLSLPLRYTSVNKGVVSSH